MKGVAMRAQSPSTSMQESYVLRESYYVLGMRIVTLEVLFVLVSLVLRVVVEAIAGAVGIKINGWYFFIITGLHLVNTGILISMIMRWAGMMYIIRPKELVVRVGVFNSRSVSYDLSALQAVTLIQSFIGKVFNFGTVKLYNPILREDIYLSNVHNPAKYAEIIKDYERGGIGFIPRAKGR